MKRKRRQPIAIEPLQPVTPDELRARLGRGGQVNWINRLATEPADLQRHPRLIITGRMKLGKTREAIELIARATRDLIPATRVFEPAPAFRQLTPGSLQAAVDAQLTVQEPALLFLDDLPWHYAGPGLDLLTAAIKALDRCRPAYIVATARLEHLTADHRAWLTRHGFYEAELPDLGEMETARLVDNATRHYELHIDDDARAALVAERDGTPERILATLRLVSDDPKSRVDAASVRRYADKSLAGLWVEARRDAENRHPAARPLFDALAAFHTARIPAYTVHVLAYAAYLWRDRTIWRPPFFPRPALRRALASLAAVEIVIRDLQIYYPDSAVEKQATPEQADQLRAFLYPPSFFSLASWIRLMPPLQYVHWLVLVLLAFGAALLLQWKAQGELTAKALRINPHPRLLRMQGLTLAPIRPAQRIADFTRSIELEPEHAASYNNRGVAYGQDGNWPAAIDDFTRAIELDPQEAIGYSNRGHAHARQGNLEQAVADANRALELNPRHVPAYQVRAFVYMNQGHVPQAIDDLTRASELEPLSAANYSNRAVAYSQQGDLLAAIADYTRAIELGSQFAIPYLGRGLAYAHQGDHAAAIADYTRAIELDSRLTAVYYNRGIAYDHQGNLPAAIADYTRALELDPVNVKAYYSRGRAYAKQGDLPAAIADYNQVLTVNADYALAYYNLAFAHYKQGNLDQALADLHRARELTMDPAERQETEAEWSALQSPTPPSATP